MFDAREAVDDLIAEINDNYATERYDAIHSELQLRVESGELSLEEAEAVNQAAWNKYFGESTPSDMGTSAADAALHTVNRDSHKSAIGHDNVDNSQSNAGTASTTRNDDVEDEGVKKVRRFNPKEKVIPNPS